VNGLKGFDFCLIYFILDQSLVAISHLPPVMKVLSDNQLLLYDYYSDLNSTSFSFAGCMNWACLCWLYCL